MLAVTPRAVEEIITNAHPQPDDVWSFMGAVMGHFYARRSINVEIPDAELWDALEEVEAAAEAVEEEGGPRGR